MDGVRGPPLGRRRASSAEATRRLLVARVGPPPARSLSWDASSGSHPVITARIDPRARVLTCLFASFLSQNFATMYGNGFERFQFRTQRVELAFSESYSLLLRAGFILIIDLVFRGGIIANFSRNNRSKAPWNASSSTPFPSTTLSPFFSNGTEKRKSHFQMGLSKSGKKMARNPASF